MSSQISDFVDTLIKAKNAIGGDINTFAGNYNKNLQNEANVVTGGINTVGNAIGNLPISPISYVSNKLGVGPPSPTVAQGYSSLTGPQGLIGEGDILHGKLTPSELGSMALFAGTLGMSGGEVPPEDAAMTDEEVAQKATMAEDVAQKPQTFGEPPTRMGYIAPKTVPEVPPETPPLKINEPESAPTIHGPVAPLPTVGSESENAGEPFSGENKLPPTEETVKTPVKEPLPEPKEYDPEDTNMSAKEQAKFKLPIPNHNAEHIPVNQAKVIDTYNTEVLGNTWAEKYNNIPEAENNIMAKIKALPNDEKIPITAYKEAGMEALKPMVNAGTITPQQAQTYVDGWVSRIYAGATNGEVNPPDFIDKDTAVEMNKVNNDATSSMYDPKTGEPKLGLSKEDQLQMSMGDASRQVIADNLKDTKDLLNQYHDLKLGATTVANIAQSEPNPNWFQKMTANPWVRTGGAVATALGLRETIPAAVGLISNAPGMLNQGNDNNPQTPNPNWPTSPVSGTPGKLLGQTNLPPTLANSTTTTAPEQSKYVADPLPTGFYIGKDYNDQQFGTNGLTNQIAQAKAAGNDVLANQLQGQFDTNKGNWDDQADIRNQWTKNSTTSAAASSLYNLIKKADPGLAKLSQTVDNIFKSGTPQGAALGAAIKVFANEANIDLSQYKTEGALLSALDTATQDQKNIYNGLVQQYFRGAMPNPASSGTTTSLSPTPSPFPQQEQSQIGVPVNYNIPGGPGGGLPQLQ
jgi:hypothetical protein